MAGGQETSAQRVLEFRLQAVADGMAAVICRIWYNGKVCLSSLMRRVFNQ